MHHFIRKVISQKYGSGIANEVSVLYGGSVKASNAKDLFSCADVDGGLIGGASLDSRGFVDIAKSF
jgi:triosephosphate isomerase (TIM)